MVQLKKIINEKIENFKYGILMPIGVKQIKKHGFWFIDIPRTSSTSIRVELGSAYGPAFGKSDVFEKGFKQIQFIPSHLTAKIMKDNLGSNEWEKIFSFTLVRNPWDRMVSLYHYRLKSNLLRQDMKFSEFVKRLKPDMFGKEGTYNYFGHYFGCADYIIDENDNVIVSFVGKYENRDKDLKYIADKIGLPGLGKLALQKALTDNKHYSEYYDEHTKNIIENVYAKDIELFKYKFERT